MIEFKEFNDYDVNSKHHDHWNMGHHVASKNTGAPKWDWGTEPAEKFM